MSASTRHTPGAREGEAPLRVILAEDSVLLREGLVRLLQAADLEVVDACPDAETFLASVREHRPDLVVVDVRMPPTFTSEGIQAALVVRSELPDVAVLVLSQYVEERYATELLAGRARGVGYLLKDRVADTGEFIDALRTVAGGGTALDPEVVSQLMSRARNADPLARLTPREHDVLRLMAQGRSNSAISRELYIGEGAVEKNVSSIFLKLDLAPTGDDHRRVLAVLQWMEHGGELR
nr:response regulator transcription factor [Ornithinimicrobium cerasi]